MELWLVRHAETPWSLQGRHTGRTDVPLTDAGRAHAARLAGVVGGRDWARVLVSPLSRARETARLAGLEPHAQLRDDLLEVDYGEHEGLTTPEIRAGRPGWTVWHGGNPGGEAVEDVGVRTDRVVAEALDVGGDVVCVAHGHLLRVLAARWLEQPAAFGERLPLAPGGVCVLGFEREARAILRWNDPSV